MYNYSQSDKNSFNLYSYLIAIIFLLFLTLQTRIYSQEANGGFAESYLLRDVGTRATSMGGAYTAIVNEPSGMFYNPAGLAFLPLESTIASSITSLDLDRTHANMFWGKSINDHVGIGFGVNSFNSGVFQGRDALGRPTRQLQNWQYSITLGMAYKQESISIGTNVKYLRNNLFGDEISGHGLAVDVGTRFDLYDLFSVGMSVQNLGSIMIWEQYDTEPSQLELLPWSLRFGLGMEFGINDEYQTRRSEETGRLETIYKPATQYVLVSLDFVQYQFDESPTFQIGTEIVLEEHIAIRMGTAIYGYNNGSTQVFPGNHWGAGISFNPNINALPFDLSLDYTVASEFIAQNGISHNIGFAIGLY